MKVRVMQIWGFLVTVLGWIFISCSLAMDGWKVAAVGGQGGSSVVYITWYWSSLWKACSTASNAVSNCYDFPVLWSVEYHVQIVRGLLMGGVAVGMLGFVLSMVGMECTYIGGKKKEKNRTLFTGSLCHIISGVLAAAGYAVYACHISAEFFNPSFTLKFDLGTPLFLGWAGCIFQVTGGIVYIVSIYKLWSMDRKNLEAIVPAEDSLTLQSISTNLSIDTKTTSRSKVSTVSERSAKSDVSDKSHHLFEPDVVQHVNS
ncbi:claudin-10 [Trichomycterus rosablanca]|uniref:claudin-10 n=1 Tax=Trichomycterus rosablanca TaxID=2290929 RepID=UPI002F35A8DA